MNEKRQNYFFIMHFHVGQLLCGKIRSFVVFLQVVRYTSSKNKRSATSRDVPPATLLPKRCVYICVCVRERVNAFVWKITSVAIARARVNVSSRSGERDVRVVRFRRIRILFYSPWDFCWETRIAMLHVCTPLSVI